MRFSKWPQVVAVTLVSLLLIHCKSRFKEASPQTAKYEPLTAPEKYVPTGGDSNLFLLSAHAQSDRELQSLKDNLPKPESEVSISDDDVLDAEINGDLHLPIFRRLRRQPPFVDPSVPISYVALRDVTSCPIPRLSIPAEVITTNAEWFIFTYCELDLLRRNQLGNVFRYPNIPAMRHTATSYNFMRHVLRKFLVKYLFYNANLTGEQKLALFERVFLVTQFRLMTTDEKTAALANINKYGLFYTARVYLANWRHSQFYADHFDYANERQPRYQTHEAFGFIKDTSGNLDGAAYKLASPFLGFKLQGTSATEKFGALDTANCFNKNQNNSFSYNFSVQYYVPVEHTAEAPHRHRRHCNSKPDHHFAISATLAGYHQGFASETTKRLCNKNIAVNMTPASVQVKRPFTWPDINRTTNANIDKLTWQISTSRPVFGTCKAPRLNTDQVFDGFQWQDFIICHTQTNIAKITPMGRYWPFFYGRSAFDLMFQVKEDFLRSEESLQLSDMAIVERIYHELTFTYLSAADQKNIAMAISSIGFDETLNVLLSTWYAKFSRSYFDYAKTDEGKTVAKNYYIAKGVVQDINGAPISGARIRALDRTVVTDTVFTNNAGTYEIEIKKIINSSATVAQLNVSAPGYTLGQAFAPLRDTGNPVITVLSRLNNLAPMSGGRIHSPNGSVSFRAFAGAVREGTSFTATDLVETNLPDFPGALTASFEVNPGYEFNGYVQLFIAVNQSLQAKVPDGDGWILMTQVDDQWQLVPSVFHKNLNLISASVRHFSRFVIVLSSQTICYNITGTEISVCLPISANLDHHPAATIFDRRMVNSTAEIPGIISQIKQRLVVGGWKPADIAVLDDPQTYISTDLPGVCANSECPPISDNIPFDFTLAPKEGVSISSISGNVTTTTSARVDIQAEQCAINPQASLPQLKLNSIKNTDINLSAHVSLNGISLTYPCIRADHICLDLEIGAYCFDWPVLDSCTDNFDGSADLTMRGFNQSYARNLDTPIKWRLAMTASNGEPYVYVPDPLLVRRPLEYCWDLAGCIYADDNDRIQAEVKKQYREKISNELTTYAMQKITDKIMNRLNRIVDPEFDDANCFGQELPNSTSNISAGTYHSCTIVDGAGKCWGYNANGQLGNNSFVNSSVPVQVYGLTTNVTSISSGANHTCAIVGGKAKCWGYNLSGQLGNSAAGNFSSIPVDVDGLSSGVTAISAGNTHTCAIQNGVVKCWGENHNGELGNGTIINSAIPTPVIELANRATSVAANGLSTCAIVNGSAMCWGANSLGQLGNNSIMESTTPVQVIGLESDVTGIATSSGSYSCAIQGGAAKCWGYNNKGQLGSSVPTRSLMPVQVQGLTANVVKISTGGAHACAIANSAAYCWGAAPEIGSNYRFPGRDFTSIPAIVTGMSQNVSEVAAGGYHTCTTVGPSVWCWGYNIVGQLGNSTTANSQLPAPVVGLGNSP